MVRHFTKYPGHPGLQIGVFPIDVYKDLGLNGWAAPFLLRDLLLSLMVWRSRSIFTSQFISANSDLLRRGRNVKVQDGPGHAGFKIPRQDTEIFADLERGLVFFEWLECVSGSWDCIFRSDIYIYIIYIYISDLTCGNHVCVG